MQINNPPISTQRWPEEIRICARKVLKFISLFLKVMVHGLLASESLRMLVKMAKPHSRLNKSQGGTETSICNSLCTVVPQCLRTTSIEYHPEFFCPGNYSEQDLQPQTLVVITNVPQGMGCGSEGLAPSWSLL